MKIAMAGTVAVIALTAFYFFAGFKREVEVTSAVQDGNPKKAGVSSKNKESAKAALNAIGEIQSVTSVGTNFSQYTSTLQNAKIKYDLAMRDFNPQDPAEEQILNQLRDSLKCYLDAKDAWQEFLDEGDQYGFLSGGNSVVRRMASSYGYSAGGSGDYYRSTVIQTIWEKAAKSFESASEVIR